MNFNNRFSDYFDETADQIESHVAGDWIKLLDDDTLNDFISTFKKIDLKTVTEESEIWGDFIALIRLSNRIFAWEQNEQLYKKDPTGELGAEYVFRLASLIQFEYNIRNGKTSIGEVLERDNEKYGGKLAILEK